jgi:8-oxo-dGTP pyrophosphatase MutT (NUDIX family)
VPLLKGKENIGHNIAEMEKAGHPKNQAIAAAYHAAGEDEYLPEHAVLIADMKPTDWRGLLKFIAEEMREPEHASGKPIAAGIVYVCQPDGQPPKVLLIKRSLDEANYAGYWSIPGGGIDEGESPSDAALRESREEIGATPDDEVFLEEYHVTQLPKGDQHITFRAPALNEFTPTLNAEHTEFAWFPLSELPKPLHPGVKEVLGRLAKETEQAPITGDDASGWSVRMAADKALGPFPSQDLARRALDLASGHKPEGLAYDKSARIYDDDGRLHLDWTHISKATVNPYLGKEIPGFEALGLEPDKVYQLFRDPAELEKAAATFNGIPLLIEHIPVSADDHQPASVVGATGTNAKFNAPYLDVALVVWAKDAIEGIESGEQKELSSAYRYRPVMTPGVWEGQRFDGRMVDIVGNHVALVEKGRAGPDVVVGDEAHKQPKETEMAKQVVKTVLSRTGIRVVSALSGALVPMIAQDKKFDFAKVLALGVTAKNFKDKKADIRKAAMDGLEGVLTPEAKAAPAGATPDDVILRVLDMVDGQMTAAPEAPELDEATAPNAAAPAAGAKGPDKAKIMEFLKGKGMSDDDMSELDGMFGAGEAEDAETDEEKAAREAKEKAAKDEENKNMVDKKAMDAAIDAAVKKASADTEARVVKSQRELAEARAFVRPWVGDVSLALDSAEAVLRAAATTLGVKAEGIHVDALRPIIESKAKPGDRKTLDAAPAMDAATVSTLATRFPHAAKITNLGK